MKVIERGCERVGGGLAGLGGVGLGGGDRYSSVLADRGRSRYHKAAKNRNMEGERRAGNKTVRRDKRLRVGGVRGGGERGG